MEAPLLLEVENLVTEFRSEEETVRAVNDISFALHRGETIGIVGESGSGKSVTALSAMQLVPPPGHVVKGAIRYHGANGVSTDLLSLDNRAMRQYRGKELAMIFQEPMTSLNPVYTCGFQVMEALLVHQKLSKKAAKARTIELFREVQLPHPESIFDSYPHQISGGQKQRVMIAMAMSCQPSVLIADEPTTALDVTVQKHILDLMVDLQARHGMGILFISHDLAVVAELADRVLVMYNGKIVEQGKVYDIFSNPQHAYTKGLLACRPPLDKRLNFLPTVSNFMQVSNIHVRENSLSISEIIDTLEETPEERKKRLEGIYAQEPVLKVEHLKTWFPIKKGVFGRTKGYVKAVNDVSFEVYPGETLGLVGESGCGKTTLGRSILRLIEPHEGKIAYGGKDLFSLSNRQLRHLRKDLQIIFQDPFSSLNPRMSVGEAILEPMKVHRIGKNDEERKEKVMALLEQVNLKRNHYGRYPHEFSGGQRQRICIARALALEPRFIICDESVSALDVSVQAKVLNLLNNLKQQYGFTYIFISHDLSVVKFMADRMLVMKEGKIEELGDADEIYTNPKSDYTRQLIDAIPKGRLEDIEQAQKERSERKA